MQTSARNRILLAAGIVLVLALIIVVRVVFPGTAGPVNPAILPGWYLPPGEGEQEVILGKLEKEQYAPIEKPGLQSPPDFPDLSRYSAFGRYKRANSPDTYRVVAWYFNNREDFIYAENRLLDFLVIQGNIHPVTLDMTRQHLDFQEVLKVNEIVYCPDIPLTLHGAAYESTNISGYFFAVKKPLSQGREDYFLIGYLAETGNLSRQGTFLQDLIARGYYNETGSYDGLERET